MLLRLLLDHFDDSGVELAMLIDVVLALHSTQRTNGEISTVVGAENKVVVDLNLRPFGLRGVGREIIDVSFLIASQKVSRVRLEFDTLTDGFLEPHAVYIVHSLISSRPTAVICQEMLAVLDGNIVELSLDDNSAMTLHGRSSNNLENVNVKFAMVVHVLLGLNSAQWSN